MVDRRIRHLNPNGKIPAPGGGSQLLEELKAPALSDFQKEMLSEVTPGSFEDSTIAPMKLSPVASLKETSGGKRNDIPDNLPGLAAFITDQKDTTMLEPIEAQQRVSFSESDGRKDETGHSGGVVLTFERVEALQAARAGSREKTASALRQLAESVASGGMPWELFQADYDGKADDGEYARTSNRRRGSREPNLRHKEQSDHLAEIVVPLGEGIVRGRALVACPGWLLLMLIFLAATCLALIVEQGFLNGGLFAHFLNSKAWTFIKLALICMAGLAALRGFFFSLFTKPHRMIKAKTL
jgi:hypothetical protein